MYIPPFTISTEAINKIAEISRLIERYTIRMEQADALKLRKANKIKTIHSSLAIEGNTLNEEQVKDILNGKPIVAPQKQIQEVRNAIETYDQFSKLDAYKEKDLLKAHSLMMKGLMDEPGRYRTCGVGVYSKRGCEHMAPPANRVPLLMSDLFDWLKNSKDQLLIKSCVFHYEFEFIHPFIDGNGRMGRLWQSLILCKLNPIFEHLPIENMVYIHQQGYYEAIAKSTDKGESGPFIDFMLSEILNSLEQHKTEECLPNKLPNKVPNKVIEGHIELNEPAKNVYLIICSNKQVTSKEIAEQLGISDRTVRSYITKLKTKGLIKRVGGNKFGYWEVDI